MSAIDSQVPKDWFARANKDLESARYLLAEVEQTFVIPAAMLLQQAVEKHLKGYLLSQNKKLKRTHDLLALLDDAIAHAPELARFDTACIKMTEYYTEQRYPPLVSSDLTKEEVLQSLAEADALVALLNKLMGK